MLKNAPKRLDVKQLEGLKALRRASEVRLTLDGAGFRVNSVTRSNKLALTDPTSCHSKSFSMIHVTFTEEPFLPEPAQ